MVRGKARYYKNRPKVIPAPAPGFKELVGLELSTEDVSPEEEKAIKQADMALYEEALKGAVPSKLLKKAIEDEIGEILTSSLPAPTAEIVIPANTEITTSTVTPAGNEQATDGLGQPINNNKRKKKQ